MFRRSFLVTLPLWRGLPTTPLIPLACLPVQRPEKGAYRLGKLASPSPDRLALGSVLSWLFLTIGHWLSAIPPTMALPRPLVANTRDRHAR